MGDTKTLAETELAEESRIDELRLTAFRTNAPADRLAYFEAASKWFQCRHYRRASLSVEQEPAAWVEQQFGARVATILENRTSVVEIQDMRDGRYSLTVHWTNSETGRRYDLSAEMSAADLAKIGALFPSKSARPALHTEGE